MLGTIPRAGEPASRQETSENCYRLAHAPSTRVSTERLLPGRSVRLTFNPQIEADVKLNKSNLAH